MRPRHLLFGVALLLGALLRVLVAVAYRPVLYYYDSFGYLYRADHPYISTDHPAGYPAFLSLLTFLDPSRTLVGVVQAVLGLAMAVLCYAFLLRRGLPAWGATLAVLPVLLDPLQLTMEHYVSSDVLFEVLLVSACLLLLWRGQPSSRALFLAGTAVAAALLVRSAGMLVVLMMLLGLLLLRVGWRRVVAFVAGAGLLLVPYMIGFHATHGAYALNGYGQRYLYARLAQVVDCDQVWLPQRERALCPTGPVAQRESINFYLWGTGAAAMNRVAPPPDLGGLDVVRDYNERVLRAQWPAYLRVVLTDTLRCFSPDRTMQVPGNLSRLWLFHDRYWSITSEVRHAFRPQMIGPTSATPSLARLLTGYRTWVWTPGPLLLVLVVIAMGAVAGVTRSARRSGNRVAILVLAGACLVPLLTGVAVSGFSWRYQLPQLPLLPMAGALGAAALLSGPDRSGSSRAPRPTPDR